MRSVDLVREIEYTGIEVIGKMDYQKLYTCLFNAITDAIGQLEQQNYGTAKTILMQAQQKTEEVYMADREQEELRNPA